MDGDLEAEFCGIHCREVDAEIGGEADHGERLDAERLQESVETGRRGAVILEKRGIAVDRRVHALSDDVAGSVGL